MRADDPSDRKANQPVAPSAATPTPPNTVDPPRPQPTTRELDRSLVSGIAWTGGMRWATQILSWASTFVIARILSPSDYGLLAMAQVYLGLVTMVSEFGLSSAIVHRRDLTEDQVARVGGVAALVGLGLYALSTALAYPLAFAFGREAVAGIVMVLSVNLIVRSFGVVPRSLMHKTLRYRHLAMLDTGSAIALIASTLAFALMGYGYWSLVFGSVISGVVDTALAWTLAPHPLRMPRKGISLSGAVTFGKHIVASRVGWYTFNNADVAIVGRVLGDTVLGWYSLAWTIASVPVERITELILRVTPGIFSTVQRDKPALRRYLSHLTEGMALLTFPAAFGMALVADTFVPLTLGEQYLGAIRPVQFLGIAAALRAVTPLTSQVLITTGGAKRNMHYTFFSVIILVPLFYLGARFGGAPGVALAWVVGHPLVMVAFLLPRALGAIEMSFASYGKTMWPALSACMPMVAGLLLTKRFVNLPESLVLSLLLQIAIGALLYGGTVLALHRRRLTHFFQMLRQLRQTKAKGA